jgi:hypothetical protein
MIKALKTMGLFAGFFVLLSISINNVPVFNHIYDVTSKITIPVENMAVSLFSKAAESTTAYTKKLFDNSIPRNRDSVKSKMSAPMRVSGPALEHIQTDEKDQLDDLIKNHR